jgi:hypothetical protein
MSTITSVRVPESLQTLIDSRLDTIDRMLLGRLPRGERLEIVREVESQIFELLQERGSDEPSREDVLAVLARLDPPEAYLPEEGVSAPAYEPGARAAAARRDLAAPRPAMPHPDSRMAAAGGVVGIAMFPLLLVIFPLTIGLAQFVPGSVTVILGFWYSLTALALAGSVTAVTLAVRSRLKSPWAVTGLITGIMGILGSLGLAVLGLFL